MDLDRSAHDQWLKQQLLLEVLNEVPFSGWNSTAIASAAQTLAAKLKPEEKQEIELVTLFPNGVAEILSFWSHQLDQQTVDWLHVQAAELGGTKNRAKVAIAYRIALLMPHQEAAKLAMAWLAVPLKLADSGLFLKLAAHTVDEIWHGLGDQSADMNWYSKRALLALIYVPTLIYWLNDASAEKSHSQEFLNHQMTRVMQIPEIGKGIEKQLATMRVNFSKWMRGL